MRLDDALRDARAARRPSLVLYLLVDRARRDRVSGIARAARDGGAAAIELGFPFSEPIADGPELAAAHARSLAHGTGWPDLLDALRVVSRILPTAVMTYANPLVRRGLDRAIDEISGAGATGLIVPDLSLEESPPYRAAARAHAVSLVLLAAPGISTERLSRIARASRGFLYLVGHYGTTGGAARGATVDLRPSVAEAHAVAPGLPVLIGFGVRDVVSTRRTLATGADGVVVGSAFERRINRTATTSSVARFVRSIADARAST